MVKKAFLLFAFLVGLDTVMYGQNLVISPGSIPDGVYGSSFTPLVLTATGGTAPYTFSVTAGSLPPGMSLGADGTLSGTPTAAGSNNFTVTATDNSSPTPNSGQQFYSMTIDPATLTVTAANQTMTYGGAMPLLTLNISGFVNGDDASSLATQPAASTTATPASPVGSYTITASGGSASNYTFSYVPGTLVISPAVLTITAGADSSNYGAPLVPPASLPVSYSGFVNGDGPGNLSPQPTVSNSANPGSPVGTYTLTPAGAGDPNYTIQYVNGSYTIKPVALTISAANKSMIYGGTLPSLTVTYSGFVNGDNASSLTTQPAISTTATSSSPAGTYPITPSGAADPNYAITYQQGTLTIGKAPLTVTADNKAMPLGGPLPTLTVSFSGFVNGDNASNLSTQPTATTTATAGSPAGTYPITPAGGVSTNYSFTYVNGSLTVAQAVLTITANPASSVYGAALVPAGSLIVTYSGFVNGDGPGSLSKKPTVANSAAAGSPAGVYTLTPSGAVDPNYAFQYVTGVYTITPAPLAITATNQSMTYGGTVPALGVTYSGFVNGDKASSLTTAPSISTTATSSSAAGAYPITPSGAADPNYTFTYNPGTLTINPASLNVSAAAEKKVFGTADPSFAYTASGFVNGDNSGVFTGSLGRTAGENVGTYPINIGSLSAGGNYTIHYTGNYLTITIASQSITWTQSLIVGCNSTTQVQLNAVASSGLPVTYSVANTKVATVSGNVLTLLQPGTTVVTARQPGDANHTAAAAVTDTVLYESSSLITQHWSDVLFFDNDSDNYVAWQWYKNDSLITGATSPYYSEEPSLNGNYFVIATNKDGQQVESCTLDIKPGNPIPGGIKAQPNPAGKGQIVTVTCNYPGTLLQGALLQLVDLSGRVRQQITNVQPSMQITMPSETGIYIINLLLSNGTRASVNVLVTD